MLKWRNKFINTSCKINFYPQIETKIEENNWKESILIKHKLTAAYDNLTFIVKVKISSDIKANFNIVT